MPGLFTPALITDFGPIGLACTSRPPRFRLVKGPRPAQLRQLIQLNGPQKPGVYSMFDRFGHLIYIGKAKNLRRRLLGYFRPASREPKAGCILSHTRAIAWETSPDEFAALHRELELIRRWRPRFNVQGIPGRRRPYTFVCLGRKKAPYLFLSRQPPGTALVAFGPVPGSQRLEEAVRRLNHLFGLRDCPETQELVFAEQGDLFPVLRPAGCLRSELGTCLAPCTGSCTRQTYASRVRAARRFLEGKDLNQLHQLEKAMTQAAATQQYEKACALRDKLIPIRWLHRHLEEFRQFKENFSLVYPVYGWQNRTIWYLLHAGRPVAAVPEPTTPASAQAAIDKMAGLYDSAKPIPLQEGHESLENLILVVSWFRRYPQERQRLLSPPQALELCQQRLGFASSQLRSR